MAATFLFTLESKTLDSAGDTAPLAKGGHISKRTCVPATEHTFKKLTVWPIP